MDNTGANNLVIAMVKQAAEEYKTAYRRGDKLTCNMINRQILTNSLVIAAGFDETWKYFTRTLTRG